MKGDFLQLNFPKRSCFWTKKESMSSESCNRFHSMLNRRSQKIKWKSFISHKQPLKRTSQSLHHINFR